MSSKWKNTTAEPSEQFIKIKQDFQTTFLKNEIQIFDNFIKIIFHSGKEQLIM